MHFKRDKYLQTHSDARYRAAIQNLDPSIRNINLNLKKNKLTKTAAIDIGFLTMSINWNNSRCIESSPLDVTNISRVTRFKMALFFDSNMFHCSVSYRNSMFLETQRDTFVNHLTQLTIR